MKYIRKTTILMAVICLFSVIGCNDEKGYSYEKIPTPEPFFDPDAATSSSLTLDWKGSRDAYSWVVLFWKDGEEDAVTELCAPTHTYTFNDLDPETTYCAQVKARVFENIDEYNSDFSDVVYGTTPPVPEVGDIDISLLNVSSSTITVAWTMYDSLELAADNNFNVALYNDEDCTDLWVTWIVTGDLFKEFNSGANREARFTFSGLDPGTQYWVKITLYDDEYVFSNPFSVTTGTFASASTNATAEVGDILLAEDFSHVIHGGDIAYKAAGITDADRSTYEVPKGINPTDLATICNWDTEYNVFTGTNVSTDYTAGLGLADWCMGTGTNTSTRPGYLKIGGSSGALGYLATPELTTIPDGKKATVEIKASIMCYVDGNSTSTGGDVLFAVVDNVVVGSQNQAEGWTTTADGGVFEDTDVVSVASAITDFRTFTATLTNVTNVSRIRISSYKGDDPDSVLTRFLLNDITVTVTDLQ